MSGVLARLRRLGCERGYSLVELVTVMALLGTVLAMLTGLFVSGSRSQMDLDHRVQAQNNAVIALSRLRQDSHCASAATVSAGSDAVTLTTQCVPSGTITWCSTLTAPGRYALRRRQLAGACTANDQQLADYVVSNAIFTTSAANSSTLAKLKASVSVRAPKMLTAYALCSVFVLRNTDFDPLTAPGPGLAC